MFNPRLPDDVEADVLQADGERLIPEPQFDLNRPVLAGPMDLSPASMLVVLADPSGSVLVEPFEAGQFSLPTGCPADPDGAAFSISQLLC